MQKLFGILLLAYLGLGTLLLPQGDFATLPDLPRMYAHCKATEDHDLDIPDFVEEHLFMLDDLMGEQPEPDDKPHQPVEFHHIYVPIVIATHQSLTAVQVPETIREQKLTISYNIYLSDYPAKVFRPPIM